MDGNDDLQFWKIHRKLSKAKAWPGPFVYVGAGIIAPAAVVIAWLSAADGLDPQEVVGPLALILLVAASLLLDQYGKAVLAAGRLLETRGWKPPAK